MFYYTYPNPSKRCGLMTAATPPAWSIFKQIFAEHWDGFKHVYPRYNRRSYDGLVWICSHETLLVNV